MLRAQVTQLQSQLASATQEHEELLQRLRAAEGAALAGRATWGSGPGTSEPLHPAAEFEGALRAKEEELRDVQEALAAARAEAAEAREAAVRDHECMAAVQVRRVGMWGAGKRLCT